MILRRRTIVVLLALLLPFWVTLYALSTVLLGFRGSATTLQADCVLVFGAAIRRGDQPGPGIRRRMDTAIALWKEHHANRIIVTGGIGYGVDVSEAAVMTAYAVGQGVPPSVITQEAKARSTMENLLYSKPLTGDCASVLGVSDRYHLARIELLAARTGWGRLPTYPAGSVPTALFEVQSVARETAAYVYYMLRIDQLWDIAPQV